jgi:hypothetical protein
MRARLIRIGAFRAIRLPRSVIEQCRSGGQVELEIEAGRLSVRPAGYARTGWDGAFRCTATQGDNVLLDPDLTTSSEWDAAEWEWQ